MALEVTTLKEKKKKNKECYMYLCRIVQCNTKYKFAEMLYG